MILACMAAYLGYNFHMFVLKLLPLEMQYMGTYQGVSTCPGHYVICVWVQLGHRSC